MITREIAEKMRTLYAQGMSKAGIAKVVGVDPKTVTKYVVKCKDHPKPRIYAKKGSILDSYKSLIESWVISNKAELESGEKTTMELYETLKKEYGYEGSYTLVQRYVKDVKEKNFGKVSE